MFTLCLLCQCCCCVLRVTVCPDIPLKLLDWQESSCCFSVGYSCSEKSKYSWGLHSLGLGNVWINMSAFCRWCHLSDFSGICIESDKLSTMEEPKFTWRKIYGASNKWYNSLYFFFNTFLNSSEAGCRWFLPFSYQNISQVCPGILANVTYL